jgi:perosamine synthetase
MNEVMACLRSGWLTTGPRTQQFEREFAKQVGARFAVAVNSCTAALHLAVEALNLRAGQAVLVPTMTFAATAEIVRYQGAVPVLVDCDPITLGIDLNDAEKKIRAIRSGDIFQGCDLEVVGIIPVHVGGLMLDVDEITRFASEHGLWVVEDAAHALPAAYRETPGDPWRRCGQDTADISCFSFYSNKTITTGEGGMATTNDEDWAKRIRQMSLHGLSHDAWDRHSGNANWDYRIIAPGYKYNLTDIAASIGIHQLRRAEAMRRERQAIADRYLTDLTDRDEVDLPATSSNRIHAWHLFTIRLKLERLSLDRDEFLDTLRQRGVACSVHWRPLHLHPYYQETFGWKREHFPVASAVWKQLLSLPLFADMREEEQVYVVRAVRDLCDLSGLRRLRQPPGRLRPR